MYRCLLVCLQAGRAAITTPGSPASCREVCPDRKSGSRAIGRSRRNFSVRTTAANLNSLREVTPVGPQLAHNGHVRLIPVALVVVNMFVENVLKHTGN